MITKIEIEAASNGFIIEVENRERKKGGVGAEPMTYEAPLKSEIAHVATKKAEVLKHVSSLLDKMTADADGDNDSKKDNDKDND